MHDATVAAADSAATTTSATDAATASAAAARCTAIAAGTRTAAGALVAAAAGFTLVEVLIATLVLALGLVGGVAMQLHAMRTRYESAQLSRAVQLAAGMAERIRANAAQTSLYVGFDYDSAVAPHPPAFAPSATAARAPAPAVAGPAVPTASGCLAASCSPAELAGAELAELQRAVARQFALGRVRICRDAQMWRARRLRWACTGGDTDPLVIKIGWRGKNPDGTPRTFGADDFAPGVAVATASAVPPPAASVPPTPAAPPSSSPTAAAAAPSASSAPSALPGSSTSLSAPPAIAKTSTRSSGGPP